MPGEPYVYVTLVGAAKFVVPPSPKFQALLVMEPVELSVKFTAKGAAPEVGLAVKLAAGAAAVGIARVAEPLVAELTLLLTTTKYVPTLVDWTLVMVKRRVGRIGDGRICVEVPLVQQRRAAAGHHGERRALARRNGLALRISDDDRARGRIGRDQPIRLVPREHAGARAVVGMVTIALSWLGSSG